MRSPEFQITVHASERIIEVVYPSHVTAEAYERYEQQVCEAIERMGGEWDCLVDQRALTVAPPEITARIAALNACGREKGMRRTARVVKESAIAELQVRRILRESGMDGQATIHRTREDAWRALTAAGASRRRA